MEKNTSAGMPTGRHLPAGPSVPTCLRKISTASGRIGDSSGLKSERILMLYLETLSIVMVGTPMLRADSTRSPPKISFHSASGVGGTRQTPERSGLPSAARGVVAARLG